MSTIMEGVVKGTCVVTGSGVPRVSIIGPNLLTKYICKNAYSLDASKYHMYSHDSK